MVTFFSRGSTSIHIPFIKKPVDVYELVLIDERGPYLSSMKRLRAVFKDIRDMMKLVDRSFEIPTLLIISSICYLQWLRGPSPCPWHHKRPHCISLPGLDYP